MEDQDAEISAIQRRAFPTFYLVDGSGEVALRAGAEGLPHDSLPPDIEPIVRQLILRKIPAVHTFVSPTGKYIVRPAPGTGSLGSFFVIAVTAFKPRRNLASSALTHNLTRREIEVVRLLSDGASTGHIAYTLGIEASTVQQYIKSAMSRTGTHSRLELLSKLSRPRHRPADRFSIGTEPVDRISQSVKSK